MIPHEAAEKLVEIHPRFARITPFVVKIMNGMVESGDPMVLPLSQVDRTIVAVVAAANGVDISSEAFAPTLVFQACERDIIPPTVFTGDSHRWNELVPVMIHVAEVAHASVHPSSPLDSGEVGVYLHDIVTSVRKNYRTYSRLVIPSN